MQFEDNSMSPSATTDSAEATSITSSNFVSPDDKGIREPGEHDVLCGRGGSINSHPGNERFRTLVEKRKRVYLTARFKREKRLIAGSIVNEIRSLNGRFLLRDSKTGLWQDIGDEKARDKTSQALRENAPSIRAEIETEINEQRAEMYQDDRNRFPIQPPPNYYSGWNPYYYNYGHPPPHHAPPPPPSGSHLYAPPPQHHSHHPSTSSHPYGVPPSQHNPYNSYYATQPDPYTQAPPMQRRSSLDQAVVDLVSSGAESIKNWTKHSFSFGATGSVASNDMHTLSSKPLSYKHEDRRRMVKFSEDNTKRKRIYSPVQSNNSVVDSMGDTDDIEPAAVDSETNTSLMHQVANQILGSVGSWDATLTLCGGDPLDEKVPFPKAKQSEYTEDNDMTCVEWEGQEVQLMEDKREDEGMPPPPPPPQRRRGSINSGLGSSIGFSSIGSCHSWLPDQVQAATSYFSGRDDNGSMEMEYSAHENYSIGESVGGASLTRVFEHESVHSPNMSHRSLNQIPSWERSVRSRSPHSINCDDDDESLISKTSSKGGHLSPVQSIDNSDVWMQHE